MTENRAEAEYTSSSHMSQEAINALAYWRYFDRVYCICLAQRPDRIREARQQFAQVGLGDLVEMVQVEKHPTNSEHGIYHSHQLCLNRGLEAGAKSILIFEDDVIFERFSASVLGNAVAFMKTHQEWKMMCLGCFVSSSQPTQNPAVLHVRYKCTTHAYAVNDTFARELLAFTWDGQAYDDLIRDLAEKQTYAIWPSFAFQSNSITSNDKLIKLDRVRRMLGGMRRLQKFNEWLHRRMGLLIVIHVALIVILIAWVCWYRS